MTCAECYLKAQTPEELLEMIERDIKRTKSPVNVKGRLNDEYIKLTVHNKHNKPILIRRDSICTILPALDGENGYGNIEGCTWITTINDSDYILVEESFDTICNMLDA